MGLRAAEDPTVRGARLFPEDLDEAHGWGVEPGGGVRAIVAGVRIVSMADGAMLVANDRLAATPSSVVALPERLGGGFLFGIGPYLWRSATWLGPPRAVFTSSLPVAQVLVGLDRVYLRSHQGALVALDPRGGGPIGLGALPASPNIGQLTALDAWRAVAVADLRGVLMTTDAGSTWRSLALPIEPSDVVALNESIAVGGLDEARHVQWWEVRADGRSEKVSTPAQSSASSDRASESADGALSGSFSGRPSRDAAMRAFGPRPLVSAIEDGWPLTDGTALVARDGALARVRLMDGALVESVADAFPINPARCHPLALSFDGASAAPHTRDAGALAFACGEPRGRTAVYRFDSRNSRLIELRRFATPRQVLGFGNGALAVRGPCASEATGDAHGNEQPWCVASTGASWTDMRFPRDDRIVVLADGRIVLVRPPHTDDLSSARLTVQDGSHRSELPIALPPMQADVAHAVRLGVWTDGFEERRPGIIGGWIDLAGSLVGVEIAADGHARLGEYIRDAGDPVASGRWAFGWTASRLGFETTDGGMTWAKIALPEPIASGRAIHERACGPVGCIAAGWLRSGWGTTESPPPDEPASRVFTPAHPPPNLDLECEPTGGVVRDTGRRHESAATGQVAGGGHAEWGHGVSELPPFAGRDGPALPTEDLGLSVEASNGVERALRGAPLARIYAWGPKSGDWDQLGHWEVRWQWPWGGGQDVRSSLDATPPWASIDGAGRALGVGIGTPAVWALAASDDPDHALLVARHGAGATTEEVFLLEAGRPPVEVRQAGGAALPEVEGSARTGGRWYIATAQNPGELAATIVWSLDGAVARELVRVPRAGFEARPALRLAQHTDGRAIGLVVDGQTDALRGTTPRWIAGIDLESNSVASPEPLAPVDLSDRAVSLCTGDDDGWEVDLPYPGAVRLHVAPDWEATLQSPVARMQLSHDRACIERVLGSVDSYSSAATEVLTKLSVPTSPRSHQLVHTVDASVVARRIRFALRCSAR
jgi:hypothetical protein